MAGDPVVIASAGKTTAATSTTFQATATTGWAVGDLLVAAVGSQNDTSTANYALSAFADSQGNTWTVHGTANRGNQAFSGVASAVATTAGSAGDTFTATLASAGEDIAIVVAKSTPGAGEAWDATRAETSGTNNSLASSLTASTSGSVTSGALGIGGFAWQRQAADTAISSPATSVGSAMGPGNDGGGSDQRAVRIHMGFEQYASSGTKSMTGTCGSGVKCSGVLVSFVTVAGGGGGTDFTQTIDDTIAGTDTVGKTAAHPVTDTASAADSTAHAWDATFGVADTADLTDQHGKTVQQARADTATATDSLGKTVTTGQADTADVTDSQDRAWDAARAVDDTAGLTDTATPSSVEGVEHTLSLDDTISAADALSRAWDATVAVDDTATLQDAIDRAWDALIAQDDQAVWTDTINTGGSVAHTRNLSDGLTVTDNQAKTARTSQADTAGLTDQQVHSAAILLADPAGLTDSLTRAAELHLLLTDQATVTDTLQAGAAIPLALTLTAHTANQLALTASLQRTLTLAADLKHQLTLSADN